MNIEKFKFQHSEILGGIGKLRRLVQAGIAENSSAIALELVKLSGVVRLHLAVEDQYLYPAIAAQADPALKSMSRRYQAEMDGISADYLAFATRWNTPQQVAADPDGFRAGANIVLRQVWERMQRENSEFYPAVESTAATFSN